LRFGICRVRHLFGETIEIRQDEQDLFRISGQAENQLLKILCNRSRAGGVSWNGLTEAPVVFLAFALGETVSPERSIGECGGGKISTGAKASENKGLKCESEKKCLLVVNVHDPIWFRLVLVPAYPS